MNLLFLDNAAQTKVAFWLSRDWQDHAGVKTCKRLAHALRQDDMVVLRLAGIVSDGDGHQSDGELLDPELRLFFRDVWRYGQPKGNKKEPSSILSPYPTEILKASLQHRHHLTIGNSRWGACGQKLCRRIFLLSQFVTRRIARCNQASQLDLNSLRAMFTSTRRY